MIGRAEELAELASACASLAVGRGCVVVVTGEAALGLLPRLAAGLREVPLLLGAVTRDEIPADTHRIRRLRGELRRVCDPTELQLRPFDRAATAQLAAAVTGSELGDELVAAL